jgi:hypothetical protein
MFDVYVKSSLAIKKPCINASMLIGRFNMRVGSVHGHMMSNSLAIMTAAFQYFGFFDIYLRSQSVENI